MRLPLEQRDPRSVTRQGDPVSPFDDEDGAIVNLGIGSNRRLAVSLADWRSDQAETRRGEGDTASMERGDCKDSPRTDPSRRIPFSEDISSLCSPLNQQLPAVLRARSMLIDITHPLPRPSFSRA